MGRGGLPDEVGVWTVVSPKEERREGKRGDPVRGRGVGVESRSDARKKEKRTVHKDGECGTMPRPHRNGVLMGPTQTVSVGHAAK